MALSPQHQAGAPDLQAKRMLGGRVEASHTAWFQVPHEPSEAQTLRPCIACLWRQQHSCTRAEPPGKLSSSPTFHHNSHTEVLWLFLDMATARTSPFTAGSSQNWFLPEHLLPLQ